MDCPDEIKDLSELFARKKKNGAGEEEVDSRKNKVYILCVFYHKLQRACILQLVEI